MEIQRDKYPIEKIWDNWIVYKKSVYWIWDKQCLSSKHLWNIDLIGWDCQCWNCKIRIRQYRYHKWAYIWDTSYHDYVYDVNEIMDIKDDLYII